MLWCIMTLYAGCGCVLLRCVMLLKKPAVASSFYLHRVRLVFVKYPTSPPQPLQKALCIQHEIDAMVLVIWSACGDARTLCAMLHTTHAPIRLLQRSP